MKYTQHWTVNNRFYPAEPIYKKAALRYPLSLAFYCPFSGEVWARRTVLDEQGNNTVWHFFGARNTEVAQWKDIEPWGTVHQYYNDISEVVELPYELLVDEFLRTYDWAKTVNAGKFFLTTSQPHDTINP